MVRKPAILIPYPLASENHQVANAKVLSDVGAAELHEEKNLEINLMQEILEGYFSENAALEARVRAYDAVKQRPLKAASIIAAAVVEN